MLHFANPLILWGLTAIAIPILVHLFNFRKYKIFYFSNTRFLQDLQKKTNQRSQLKKLLILLMRILAIIAIVLAFSRPYWNNEKGAAKTGNSVVGIYIDNSFSMENVSQRGNLLQEAKLSATAIANAYQSDDKFMLITNDFEGKHQQFVDKEEFIKEVENVQITSVSRKMSEIYDYVQHSFHLQNNSSQYLYFISDFQISATDLAQIKRDTMLKTTLIPLISNEISNIYIDTLYTDAPDYKVGQQVVLHVVLRNTSDADVEKLPVRLYVNQTQKALAVADIPKNGFTEIKLNYTIDNQRLQDGFVEITDYPITFDDKMYFSFLAKEKSKILFLYDKSDNEYFTALFGKDSTVDYEHTHLRNVNYSTLAQQSLIIIENSGNLSNGLVQELTQYVQNGGILLILPPAELETYDNALNQTLGVTNFGNLVKSQLKISELNLQHPLFANVFEQYPENISLPSVFQYFTCEKTLATNKENIIETENGNPLLFSQKIGSGTVFLMSVYPSDKFTDFQRHAVFVPAIYNMSLFSGIAMQLYVTIGVETGLTLNNLKLFKDEIIEIKDKDIVFIPLIINNIQGSQLIFNEKIEKAGNFGVWYADSLLMGIAFNYNRLESDMKFFDASELKDLLKKENLSDFKIANIQNKSAEVVNMQINSNGLQLYVLFVILALAALLGEILIIRFWK
ncbi:MAG: BatA domain-containing protein [Bacteroidales bacterium]|jgi:hypothetical protein|nr:BatA domain-containing protein [Bacteroidales bacterium]